MGVKGKACDSSAVTAFHIAPGETLTVQDTQAVHLFPLVSHPVFIEDNCSHHSLLLMASHYFSPTVALEATC